MFETSSIAAYLSVLEDLLIDDLRRIVDGRTVILVNQSKRSPMFDHFLHRSGASDIVSLLVKPRNHAPTLTEHYDALDEFMSRPPREFLDSLDRIDPHRRALVYAGSTVTAAILDGRIVLGRRLRHWKAAETKEAQTRLMSKQAGYSPSYISSSALDCLDRLVTYCFEIRPCILSGDPVGAISMGSDHVFMVDSTTPPDMVRKICRWLLARCSGVRIAPFTYGVPVTLYGLACNNAISCLGPVEALVGYRADQHVVARGILLPANYDRSLDESDREDATRVSRRLVSDTGYRGAFGVDGVHTSRGFIAHEVNTRICAGFSLLSRVLGNRIPFNIADLVLRQPHASHGSQVVSILRKVCASLVSTVDVKLWSEPLLEQKLRANAPALKRGGELRLWKQLVRSRVLYDVRPFVSMSPDNEWSENDYR